jgi:hypothetical protein
MREDCFPPHSFDTGESVSREKSGGGRRRVRSAVLAAAALLLSLALPGTVQGQQPGEHKIPVLGKTVGGNYRQAFTGKVQSLDTKFNVLNMKAAEGAGTEIFPVKKDVEIKSAKGEKLKLDKLKPGSDVIIYYEQKGGQRKVKEIILLEPNKQEAKKKPAPES